MRHAFLAIPAVAVLFTAGCELDAFDDTRLTEDFEYSADFPAGGRLTVDNFNGSVEIHGWNQNRIEVKGTKYASSQEWLDRLKVDFQPATNGVSIKTIRPTERSWRGSLGVKYVIQVPRRALMDRIESSNGAISVYDIDGQGHFRTSNGPIRLERYDGDVEADTSNGPIHLEDFRGAARMGTSNGPITADSVTGALRATTSNGTIRLENVRLSGTEPAKLRTSNGSIHLKLAAQGSTDLNARTSNGSISVDLPKGANARISANTSNSSIDADLDSANFSTKKKTQVEATLGSGGPMIDVATSNGKITLRNSSRAERE